MPSLLTIGLLPMLLLILLLRYAMTSILSPPLDLIPITQTPQVNSKVEERAKEIKKLHKQVRAQVEKVNEQDKAKA